MSKDSLQRMIAVIETGRNEPLSQNEVDEIELWEKGKALSQIVGTYGWEIALGILKSYVVDQLEQIKNIDPSKRDEIAACQSVLFAANRIYDTFVQDINNAIEFSSTTPDAIKGAAKKIRTNIPLEHM